MLHQSIKKSRLEKSNYRPVSLLPNVSRLFEWCMGWQISEYFETVLSKFQCGFRKGYSTQDCLLALVEKHNDIDFANYVDNSTLYWIGKTPE